MLCIGAGALVVCICTFGAILAVNTLKKQHIKEVETDLESVSESKESMPDTEQEDRQGSTEFTAKEGYILTELNAEGTTIIMVTHSLKDAAFAQRTINLFDGQIVSDVKNEL